VASEGIAFDGPVPGLLPATIVTWPPTAEDFARLHETLAWVAEHSPWYRQAFDAAGVRVADLRSYADFHARVPRTERPSSPRTSARTPFGEFLAVPRESIASLHTSPGPIYIPRLAEERGGTPVLVDALRAMGVRRGEVAHVTLSYHVMPGGLRLHRALEEHGCLVINGGTGASRLQVQLARDYGATVYAGTPSFLANLGDTAREMGLDPRRDLRYRLGFSTAEALTPALRRDLEATFGIELFDHIGEAQIGPVAGECRAHEGMHLHARDLFCEFLDPETGEPAEPGGVGELVATQLGRRAAARPLRAARRGSAGRLCGDPARASRSSDRSASSGRSGRAGIRADPRGDERVPALGRFQVVVEQPAGQRYERALLRAGTVTPPSDPDALRRAVAERLKATVLIQMEVELVPEADVPETAAPPRFVDAMVKR
jgi:phenylacetate-CoA ligase